MRAIRRAVIRAKLFVVLSIACALPAPGWGGLLDRDPSHGAGRLTAIPNPENPEIGGVSRTKAHVEGVLGDLNRSLRRDLPVYQNEEVNTGPNARAVLRFRDGSVLAIGPEAEVVLDEFVYSNAGGVITLLKGAMRFTSGKLGRPGMLIKMPNATIGIRGTDVWAGETAEGHGVMLISGEVDVFNDAGLVTLKERYQGTLILGEGRAPSPPAIWSEPEQHRVLAGVAFNNGILCSMLQRVAKNMFPSCS